MRHRNGWPWIAIFLVALFACLLCLSSAGAEDGIAINGTNFPDQDFRNIVKDYDKNHDGFLSEEEIAEVKIMHIVGKNVEDMNGIKFFTSLTELKCIDNDRLEELDIGGCTTLTKLECSTNPILKKLDVSGCTALEKLDCSDNTYLMTLDCRGCTALKELECHMDFSLTALDVSGCTSLESLKCSGNALTSLDISGCMSLAALDCSYNALATLDASGNTVLESLVCFGNDLTTLNISGCTSLKSLDCGHNGMTTLDVSGCTALEKLNCDSNHSLTTLDVSGSTALKELDCLFNESLTSLDVSGCLSLESLNCSENALTSLDISGCTSLKSLDCSNNDLTTLDVSGCTALEKIICDTNHSLTSLDISGCKALEDLDCSWNQLRTLDISGCTSLKSVDCRYNSLEILNFSGYTSLKYLNCIVNDLKSLDVSGCTALENLECGANDLTTLDVSGCTALENLECGGNDLKTLDVSGCAVLVKLVCDDNELSELDISHNTFLKYCYCEYNKLKNLDVNNCPTLASLVKQEKRRRDKTSDRLWDEWAKGGPGERQAYLSIDTNVEVTAGNITSMPLPSREETIKGFIIHCYRMILNREPDMTGMNTWLNELTSGRKAAAEIIDRFVNSPEFLGKNYSNKAAVDILYQVMLDRNADPAGKANWVSKLENGQTLANVINGFCFSREFQHLCDVYEIKAGCVNVPNTETTTEGKIKAFVLRCYLVILERAADPGGMLTWHEQLSSGKKTAAEIIDRFVNSPEFSAKHYSPEESVEILYKAMLGRSSDPAGKQNWVDKLKAGQPFAVVINGFCVSKEFTGICASYGIKPGNVNIRLSAQSEEELSMLALNAKEPITRRSETKPNRVEIINPSDTIDMNIGTAVQAVYINEEKAKEFIGRCYRVILGRDASAAELENWIGQMVNGTKSPDQIARGFLFSNEFKAKNVSSEELVKILYRVYMNRDADPEGLKTWTEKLNNGTSLKDLLDIFAKTNEFKKVVSEMSK